MTRTLLDIVRAYWPANTYYTPPALLTLEGAATHVPSNPPFCADVLDAPTAPGKTPPAHVIIERLNRTRPAGS